MLAAHESKALLALAHRALAALFAEATLASNETGENAVEHQYAGVFVSVYVRGKLRGCIGHLGATDSLRALIVEMTQAAASNDPRFKPVRAEELPDVTLEISLLHPMHALRSPKEIVIGRDGLMLRKGSQHGLLLPQVAAKRAWDALTFLEQTCCKADLPPTAWRDTDAEVFRFAADVLSEQDPHA